VERWADVDEYLREQLVGDDPVLDAALSSGLPPHDVSPLEGKLLGLLARACGARRVLELGTLAGYSTIWLARSGAHVISLEIDPRAAAIARENVDRAGVGTLVEIRVGPALESLPGIEGPFDMAFLDADKQTNPEYLDAVLPLLRPGGLLVADNVVRAGAIADGESDDPRVVGLRRFMAMLREDPRIDASAIQTVGAKGHDGFVLAVVTEDLSHEL
jgi:predicted O-methyltransferase YrrM